MTTTKDIFGFYTEALLVTGYPDTGPGDAPPIGSVYNTINFLNLSNVYSSIPQDDGTDKITNILTNTRPARLWTFPGSSRAMTRRQRSHRPTGRPGVRLRMATPSSCQDLRKCSPA